MQTGEPVLHYDVYGVILRFSPVFSRVSAAIRAIYDANMYEYDDYWRALLPYATTGGLGDLTISAISGSGTVRAVYENTDSGLCRYDAKYRIFCYLDKSGRIHIHIFSNRTVLTVRACCIDGLVKSEVLGTDISTRLRELIQIVADWIDGENWAIMIKYMTGCGGAGPLTMGQFDILASAPPFLRAIPPGLVELIVS